MSELERREDEIDPLLQRFMAAPIPTLSNDFDRRLLRKLRRDSPAQSRYRAILLMGYGATSVLASAVVMRGQGLGWGAIALIILGTLALVSSLPGVRNGIRRFSITGG